MQQAEEILGETLMELERRTQLLLSPSYGMSDSCKDHVCFLKCITRLELPTLRYFN